MRDSTVSDSLRADGHTISEMAAAQVDEATALFVAAAINLQAHTALLDRITDPATSTADLMLDAAHDITSACSHLPALMQELASAATDLLVAYTNALHSRWGCDGH